MKKVSIYGTDEVIYVDKCDNGLEIYMYVNEKVKNFYATLNVKYGAAHTEFMVDEKRGVVKVPHGIAHFLEHLKFNLPNKRSANEFFGKLGSSINAATSHDFTAYEVFASCYFRENIEHLLNYVQTNYFTKGLVEKEKGIIIEEIKMYDDTPGAVLYSKMNECLYLKDNRRFLISGVISDVKKTSVEHMRDVYDTFYHPENMFIILTGNFNPEEAVAIIKENQSGKKFPKYLNPVIVSEEEPIEVAKEFLEVFLNIEIPKVKVSFKMDRNNFKNLVDLELKVYLNIILGAMFGPTSELKEELLKKALISGDIATNATVRNNYVVLSVVVETNYPKEIVKIIKETMEKLSITKETIERRKKVNQAITIVRYDDIGAINGDIQDEIILYGGLITDFIKLIKNINIETAEKIRKKIQCDNYSIVVMYPLEKEEIN